MQGSDIFINGFFQVEFGNIELGFSKVSGIKKKIEYETFTEGGGIMHILPKHSQSPESVVFERGVILSNISNANLNIQVGFIIPKINITIYRTPQALKEHSKDSFSLCLYDALVTGFELGDLDAVNPNVAVNKLEIMHTGA
jgi:phage tail-like protein